MGRGRVPPTAVWPQQEARRQTEASEREERKMGRVNVKTSWLTVLSVTDTYLENQEAQRTSSRIKRNKQKL